MFIYMELVKGVTLEDRWELLSKPERIEVCEQLRAIRATQLAIGSKGSVPWWVISYLKRPQNAELLWRSYQPSVSLRYRILDIVFTDNIKPSAGPFASVKEFHDWLSYLIKRGKGMHWPDPSLIPDPFQDLLPDDSPITFTHADLHPSNIMVSANDPCRIVSIIDWHQSGWYPAYWEYCKAAFTAEPNGEWETEYIPRFLEIPDCYDAWAFYPRSLGY